MHEQEKIQEEEYNFPYHYVAQYKESFTQVFCDSWGINYVSTIEFLLSRLENEKFESVVDIGCGDGRFTQELASAFPAKKVVGIDYSRKAVALASAMAPTDSQAKFVCVDIVSERIENGKYDLGILMEVFEHISPEKAENFVGAVARLLNPGGVLYVTVPHTNKSIEPKHFRHFTSHTLFAAFSPFFEMTDVIPIERRCAAMKWVNSILTNRYFILNNERLKQYIYQYYKKRLFHSKETECQRIVAKMVLRSK
jgi:2-polyprenyl-3-methyl-5-hydroxy-6-metoxy-1,4-benzoquinol methylase